MGVMLGVLLVTYGDQSDILSLRGGKVDTLRNVRYSCSHCSINTQKSKLETFVLVGKVRHASL